MQDSKWYCAAGKQKLGPFSFAQLQQRARDGELQPNDMVLQEGSSKWAAAKSVDGLFAKAAVATPAAKPATDRRLLLWGAGAVGALGVLSCLCVITGWAVMNSMRPTPAVAQEKKKQPPIVAKSDGKKSDPIVKPQEKTPPEKKPTVAKKTGDNPARVKGLASVKFNGTEYLRDGKPRVRSVTLETTDITPQGKDYQFEKKTDEPTSATFDAKTNTYWQAYPWGTAEVQYRFEQDRLDLAITLENQTQQVIANFEVVPLELLFPTAPSMNQPNLRNSFDNLGIVEANLGSHRLIACNLTIDSPMVLGFDKSSGESNRAFPVLIRGGVHAPEPGAYVLEPLGVPRIEPGKSLKLEVTLRLLPSSMATLAGLDDVVQRFRAFHSPGLKWTDRRPIGMILRASGYKDHVSKTNPRGWFNNPKLDVLSPNGKSAFRDAILQDAKNSVASIKATGGQGMIFWDMEGQENPHPISFIGDPLLTKTLAPEMDEVADDYFKVFRDAGLRTGVCIRPSQVYFNEATKKWDHGTGSDGGPDRGNHYPSLRPAGVPWWKFYPIAERLSDRIAYAKKRWGCTLFYVDTNGIFRQTGEDQKFLWHLVHADIWKRVQAKHPDVLLVLELPRDDQTTHVANWAYTAGYMEIDLGGFRTSDYVRTLLPDAFSIVVINDGDFAKNRAEIKTGVQRGDILMFRGWFGDERNAWVKTLYDEVKKGK